MSLHYLFEATYRDGSVYRQGEDDVSVSDPSKSSFFDVDHENLASFSLIGQSDGLHRFYVDLIDGHFEVDGIPFRLHEGELDRLRLVFFRRHTHDFNVQMEELAHEIVYRIGWQALDGDGKNVQHVMEIG